MGRMRRVARRVELVFGCVAAAVVATGIIVVQLRSKDDRPHDAKDTRAERDDPAPVVGPGSGAGVEVPRRGELTDADYQFRLIAPGPEWEVFARIRELKNKF